VLAPAGRAPSRQCRQPHATWTLSKRVTVLEGTRGVELQGKVRVWNVGSGAGGAGAARGSKAVGALYRVMAQLQGLEAQAAAFHCLSCEQPPALWPCFLAPADGKQRAEQGRSWEWCARGRHRGEAKAGAGDVLLPMLEGMLRDGGTHAGEGVQDFPWVCQPSPWTAFFYPM